MMNSWWLLWTVFMLVILVTPTGYGWGYRGWGPPYPSYVQRRRSLRADAAGSSAPFDHFSWGWGGDIIWLALIIGAFWTTTAFFWPVWHR